MKSSKIFDIALKFQENEIKTGRKYEDCYALKISANYFSKSWINFNKLHPQFKELIVNFNHYLKAISSLVQKSSR